jgi:hypothetical protein
MAGSYAYLKTNSATSNIANTALNIFDTDLYSGDNPTAIISDDITWTEDAGTLTFQSPGVYHVILSAVVNQVTGEEAQTFKFIVNSTDKYIATTSGEIAHTPLPRPFQTILKFAAGDVLHVKASVAGHNITIAAGSTLVVTKIVSGIYAKAEITTSGTTGVDSEFDPFDTDDDDVAVGRSLSSGITFASDYTTATVSEAGRYVLAVTNIATCSSSTACKFMVDLGGSKIYTIANTVNSSADPGVFTIYLVLDLDADDVITILWDSITGGRTIVPNLGTCLSMYKLAEDGIKRQDAYATVYTEVNSAAAATKINPFDNDSYGTANFSESADKVELNKVAHTAADGTFEVSEPGLYHCFVVIPITVNGDLDAQMEILVNGGTVLTSIPKIDSTADPATATISALLPLKAGDSVSMTVDSDNSQTIRCDSGGAFNLYRVYPFINNESSASGLIDNDYTINTFSQTNLSTQFDRNVDQVPFKFGIRGPGTLRGRTDADVVTLGDKKN